MKPEKLLGSTLAVLLSLALLSVPMAWGARSVPKTIPKRF
jgi:hypothetical protein